MKAFKGQSFLIIKKRNKELK